MKLKKISVNLELPINSNINPDDLRVSTLLTDQANVKNSASQVETFNNDGLELTFASNAQER